MLVVSLAVILHLRVKNKRSFNMYNLTVNYCSLTYSTVTPDFKWSKHASQYITKDLMVLGKLIGIENDSILLATLTITNRNFNPSKTNTFFHYTEDFVAELVLATQD